MSGEQPPNPFGADKARKHFFRFLIFSPFLEGPIEHVQIDEPVQEAIWYERWELTWWRLWRRSLARGVFIFRVGEAAFRIVSRVSRRRFSQWIRLVGCVRTHTVAQPLSAPAWSPTRRKASRCAMVETCFSWITLNESVDRVFGSRCVCVMVANFFWHFHWWKIYYEARLFQGKSIKKVIAPRPKRSQLIDTNWSAWNTSKIDSDSGVEQLKSIKIELNLNCFTVACRATGIFGDSPLTPSAQPRHRSSIYLWRFNGRRDTKRRAIKSSTTADRRSFLNLKRVKCAFDLSAHSRKNFIHRNSFARFHIVIRPNIAAHIVAAVGPIHVEDPRNHPSSAFIQAQTRCCSMN